MAAWRDSTGTGCGSRPPRGRFTISMVEDLGDDLAHYSAVLADVKVDRAERGLAPLALVEAGVLAVAPLTNSEFYPGRSIRRKPGAHRGGG